MRRNSYSFMVMALLALAGCKTFKKLGELETAIKQYTHHQDVNIVIGTSTSEGKRIKIILFNYPVDSRRVAELKRQATSIDSITVTRNSDWKNIQSRIVSFSSSTDPEGGDNIISFKFPALNSK